MKIRRLLFYLLPVTLTGALLISGGPGKKDAGNVPCRISAPRLNLMPDIKTGLNFAAVPKLRENAAFNAGENAETLKIDVWNGKETLYMELEDYIIHTVAGEMPANYEPEALKAQATAARTFTVKHILGEARCRSGHTVCTNPACCQAFKSTAELKKIWGSSFKTYYNRIKTAVKATEGKIITCDGKVINAFYHSSSGGKTEASQAVFAAAFPYLVPVESFGEENYSDFTSVKEFSISEFMKKVNNSFPEAQLTSLNDCIGIWGRTESGRVELIRLGNTVINGQQMRNLFKLHSTNFSLKITGGKVIITCKGFGHGVGMSQCGANEMAKRGASYEEILKHYYTGVTIENFILPSVSSVFLPPAA